MQALVNIALFTFILYSNPSVNSRSSASVEWYQHDIFAIHCCLVLLLPFCSILIIPASWIEDLTKSKSTNNGTDLQFPRDRSIRVPTYPTTGDIIISVDTALISKMAKNGCQNIRKLKWKVPKSCSFPPSDIHQAPPTKTKTQKTLAKMSGAQWHASS